MNLYRWFFGPRSVREVALTFYKQGLAKCEQHDAEGAISAYTAAIEVPKVPDDLRAMALYNRALLFTNVGKAASAIADLNTVLAMTGPVRGIKAAVRRRLARMQHQHDVGLAAHPSMG
jgi:hypothetical protein